MAYRGGAKYLDWHNALYATGKVEGALTEHDVYTTAQHYLTPTQLAAVKKRKAAVQHMMRSSLTALAQHMDFSGTPAFVVMPQTQNGDVKRVTVIPEARLRICCKWRFRKRRGDIRSEENAQE